jgi:hypothetical protein
MVDTYGEYGEWMLPYRPETAYSGKKKPGYVSATKQANTQATLQTMAQKVTPTPIVAPTPKENLTNLIVKGYDKLRDDTTPAGIIKNTLIGLPQTYQDIVVKKPLEIAKNIAQGIARETAGLALDIHALTTQQPQVVNRQTIDFPPDTTEGKLQQILYGQGPVVSTTQTGENISQWLQKSAGVSPEAAKVLGPLGAVVSLVIDFTGAGGEKNALKAIAKAKTIEEATQIGKDIKIADDLLPDFAKGAVAVKDEKEAKALVDHYAQIQEETKIVPKGETDLTTEVLKPTKEVVDPFAKYRIERGFVTSVKEQFPDMEFVGGQYIPRSTDRLSMKAANLVKSDPTIAENMAKTGTDDASVAVAAELIKAYNIEAKTVTNPAIKNTLYQKAAEVANSKAVQLTESGRTVQAASILGRLTPEGQLMFAQREINRYNEAVGKSQGGLLGLQKKIPNLTPDQTEHILKEMDFIGKMPEGTDKAKRFYTLQHYVQDLVPSSLMNKIIAVWKSGLLTGLKTSGLNIFSNLTHFTSEAVKNIPASAVDSVASLFTKERTTMFPSLRGVKGGVKEGFDKGLQYIKTGYDERGMGLKLDYKRVNFGKSKVGKALQRYEETVFHIIGAEDQPFYYGAKAQSLFDQALAMAHNKGLRGSAARDAAYKIVENPTDKMLSYAVRDAEIAVFQNQTWLGKAAKSIQNIPYIGQILLPFGRTPSSVAMQIINYSPIGIIKTIGENIGKGKFDQRLFSQGIGRGVVGTGVLWLGGELYKKGLIALDRPIGEKDQKLWELEGKVANSIKVNGKWRTAQTLGPIGNLLIIGGHFKNAFSKSGSPTEAMSTALAGSAKTFTEQTFLQGISSAVSALTDPAGYAQGYLGSTISSVIPTIVSDVARVMDAKERRSSTIGERLKARIPGLRPSLEPQVTVLGKERERVGSIFEVMVDPTRPSKEITTPLIAEFKRLADAGYKASPTLLGDKQGYLSLTPKENTQLWKRAGQLTESKLNNLIRLEEYRDMPDDQKAKPIENITNQAKIVARAEIVLQKTQGLEGDALRAELKKQKESGLMTREVYAMYLELR